MESAEIVSRIPAPPPEPEVVYHYTTVETMLKIVKSGEIWATSIDYLNDVRERTHFLELIRLRIPGYKKKHGIQQDDLFQKLMHAPSPTSFETMPFVASFSMTEDSLPQWRSYCPNGNGISIGFRTDCLRRASIVKARSDLGEESSHVRTRCVDYLGADDPEAVDWVLDLYHWVAIQPGDSFKSENVLDQLRFAFEVAAYTRKDPSFAHEKEYRVLASGIPLGSNSLRFRATRSTLVPYVALSIPRKHSQYKGSTTPLDWWSALEGRWDFVDRVVIGPTTNMTLSQAAVEAFFRSQNMAVDVQTSKIPYRDW